MLIVYFDKYYHRVINTLCEKIITLDFVSGDNFPPRVLIYPNTFIQGQYIYIKRSLVL
jgi:hypothetical protein